MNRKAKGSRNERKSRDRLLALGYEVCKSGGSLGEFDLIGIRHDQVILVQSKSNRRPSTKEIKKILEFSAPKCAVKEVHIWVDRQRNVNPIIMYEEDMRKVINGEPFKIASLRSVVRKKRNNNNRKTKDRAKQRTGKKRNTAARSVSTAKPGSGEG